MTAQRMDDMMRRSVRSVFTMLLRNLLHYPRRVFVRRVLFQVHDEIEPVFVHPTTGEILGGRPADSWLGWLQDLHFYLLGGETGLIVNGGGALSLLALALTGLVVWWAGVGRWRRALGVDFGRPLRRINRDLHAAVGFWTSALIIVWAASGAYFAFPAEFRSVVDSISPLSAPRAPVSRPAGNPTGAPDLAALITTATQAVPGGTIARVSFPETETEAIEVVVAPDGIREANEIGYVSFFFDQHGGQLLERRSHVVTSVGDAVMAWIGAVHTGNFGGLPVRILWAALGLAPALLFVTGALMWWQRVVRRELRRRARSPKPRVDRFRL